MSPAPPNDPSGVPRGEPWDRQPKETQEAFSAFRAFVDLGEGRSLVAVADRVKKSHSLIRRWATRWDWHERVRLAEVHEAAVARGARDGVIAATAAVWEQRRQAEHEDLHKLGGELRDLARRMIDTPLHRQVDEGGETIMKPAGWTFATACTAAKISAELRAAGIDGATAEPDDGFDPLTRTPEECAAYIQRQLNRRRALKELAGPPSSK